MRIMPVPLPIGGLLLMACTEPAHLQRTHGQAYAEAFGQQAQLERPAAEQAAYALSGEEGLALRRRAVEAASDSEVEQRVSDTE